MNQYYVYIYKVDDTDEIFYVGKGKGKRSTSGRRNKFCEDMKNTHNWSVEIIADHLTEEDAFTLEALKIKEYKTKGYRITNQTNGGDGISGYVMTDDIKKKISISSIEKWKNQEFRERQLKHRREGIYQSSEFRKKISSVTKGDMNGNFGNKWTDEMKDSMSKKRVLNGKSKGVNNPRATKIMCVETGKVYDCIKFAQEEFQLKSQASLTIALDKPNRTAGGCHWVKV